MWDTSEFTPFFVCCRSFGNTTQSDDDQMSSECFVSVNQRSIDEWLLWFLVRRITIIIMMSCCFVFRFVFHMWIVCYCLCNRFFCLNSLTVPNDDGVAHTFQFILYSHRLACQRIVINRNIQILINKPAAARMSRVGIVILSHRSRIVNVAFLLCDDDDPIRLKEFGIFIQLLAAWFDQSIKFHFDIGLSILTRISSGFEKHDGENRFDSCCWRRE